MENLPRKLEKTLKAPPARPRPVNRSRTLLMVDETTGQTREVTWMRGLMKMMSLLLCAAVLSAVLFFFLYRRTDAKNQLLQAELALFSRQEIENPAPPSSPKPPAVTNPALETLTETPEEKEKPAAEHTEAAMEQESPDKAETAASPPEPEPSETAASGDSEDADLLRNRVTADDFTFRLSPEKDRLSIRFNIRNSDPGNGPVTGHAILVLNSGDADPKKRIAVPKTPLVSGRPTGAEKGETFSISRFKTMKLNADGLKDAARYKICHLFVFDNSGVLMLEQEIPLDLKAE